MKYDVLKCMNGKVKGDGLEFKRLRKRKVYNKKILPSVDGRIFLFKNIVLS